SVRRPVFASRCVPDHAGGELVWHLTLSPLIVYFGADVGGDGGLIACISSSAPPQAKGSPCKATLQRIAEIRNSSPLPVVPEHCLQPVATSGQRQPVAGRVRPVLLWERCRRKE